jgi:hypothetical protein
MKGLMPLTLSSASSLSSASTTNLPIDDGMGERVDEYFPEILAHDLELASAIFAARSMTAGAPSHTVAAEYMARAKAAGIFTERATSPYRTASARVQLLGSIEERDSIVSFFEKHQQQQGHDSYEDSNSDLETTSSTEESSGMPPPSFRYRNHSVVTNATSVEGSTWRLSPKPSPPPQEPMQEPPGCIWIDEESDDESEAHTDEQMIMETLSLLSPRPPSPPQTENDSTPPKIVSAPVDFRTRMLHRKSHSVSGGSPMGSPQLQFTRQPLGIKINDAFPRKHASREAIIVQKSTTPEWDSQELAAPPPPAVTTVAQSLATPPPPLPQKHEQRPTAMRTGGTTGKVQKPPRHVQIVAEPSPVSDEFPDSDEGESVMERVPEPDRHIWGREENTYSRPTPPPSPRASVLSFAQSNIKPYIPPFRNDELAKVVPLPPDVIETLRVSIACFPETMLLSSSLTIETIRSYSKKMRHPNMDAFRASPPQSPGTSGRKSLWKRVNRLKRGASSASLRADTQSMDGSMAQSVKTNTVTSNPLKNVFSCCSDYICDALYAHMVAYNYISALVARMPAPPMKRMQSHGGRMSYEYQQQQQQQQQQQESIPKKAASLLGLSGGGNSNAGSDSLSTRGSLTKRTSGQPALWPVEEMVTRQSASSANHDNAVRGIHAGLLRCIARLISTARLMSESGSIEERLIDMEKEDTDMLFMRSLCELVRMAEEAS